MNTKAIVAEICEDISNRTGLGDLFDDMTAEQMDGMYDDLVAALKVECTVESVVTYIQSKPTWQCEWGLIDADVQEEILDAWQTTINNHHTFNVIGE